MKYFLFSQILLISTLCGCTQAEDQWAGVYTNQEIGLIIEVKKSGNQYSGFFELQKQRYAFTGYTRGALLEANYNYGGQIVPFTISATNGVYNLNSEGFDISMQRSSKASTQALAKSENNKQEDNIASNVPAGNGKRISDPYGGYSFQVPQGWILKEEGGSYTITAEGEASGFTITPHNFKSKEEMMQGLDDDNENSELRVTGKEDFKNGMLFRFEGTANDKPVIVEIISTLSPYEGGVSFIAAGQPLNYTRKYTELLKVIANSVRFTKPNMSAAAQQWLSRLKGKQLIYLHTSGGGSEKIVINLAANGEYSYSNNSSYVSGGSDVLSYAGKDGNSGTWKIQSRNSQTVLVLFGNDNSTREYILTPRSQNGEINLGNRRYFIKSLN
jgi:hypothetical protein